MKISLWYNENMKVKVFIKKTLVVVMAMILVGVMPASTCAVLSGAPGTRRTRRTFLTLTGTLKARRSPVFKKPT